MGKKPKRRRGQRPPALVPAYDLATVKRLIRQRNYRVVEQALRTAWADFGWTTSEIERFYLNLRPRHFHKKVYAEHWDTDWLDVYRAELFGQMVYTHFFISADDQLVIVNSLKRDTSGEDRR